MPSPEGKITATIVDDTSQKSCSANCGTDWSSSDQFNSARQRVLEAFRGKAELKYLDLGKVPEDLAISAMRLKVEGMPLPVLLVGDMPRIAGEFDLRQLVDVIETGLEAEI